MVILTICLIILSISLSFIKNNLNSSLIRRISAISFIYAGVLICNTFNIQKIGSGIGLYSGLFQVTTVTQYFDIFIAVTGAIILSIWPSNGLVEMSENTRPLQSKNYYTNFKLLNVISKQNAALPNYKLLMP